MSGPEHAETQPLEHPLRRWRREQQLTLEALGEKLGVPATTLCNYEIGRRIPRRKIMDRIQQVTQGVITPNDFYAGQAG